MILITTDIFIARMRIPTPAMKAKCAVFVVDWGWMKMTVKNLISELLEMPMNATILLATQNDETGEYKYFTGGVKSAVDYEDGTCGILVSGKETK